ncbi:hypothetical protein [Desulfovibrio porci]|uniref:hypothetical protein n=1 Tax=Desulfovibrio porci TaxID=2605782 RepID=UPI003A953CED
MKLIIPNKLELLACSLAETDEEDGVVWDASTSYAKDARVRHEHVSYTSLVASNKGNDPSKNWSGLDAKWKKIGATKPWRMLDDYVETQTEAPEGEMLTFSVPFNRCTAFALLNIEGVTATVTITDDEDGEEYYSADFGLMRDISGFSLHEYNYDPVSSRINVAATDLPMPITGVLTVSIDPGEGSVARLGHVVAGAERALGSTLYDAELGVTDYSKKDVDEFGVATLVRRSFASVTSLPLYLHPDRMDFVAHVLQGVRAVPCVFIGDNEDNGHQSLTVYGWLEDWRMVCAGPNEIQMSLEIQGLI